MPVAQGAEAPVRKAAATDADQVHDAVSGRPHFGTHDLGENRHVVAIEESPADAVEDQERDRQAELRRQADAEQRRQEEVIPMALTKIRPRSVRRIQESASQPPRPTPTSEANCTGNTA